MNPETFTATQLIASAPSLQGGPPQTGEPSGTGGGAGGGAQPQQSPFGGGFLFILIGLFLFMIIMSTMSGRKEKKRRQEMLNSLSRHDRVQTHGGLIGTIVEIKGDEVVLKVDESNNTRIHFSKGAVQSVLKQANQPDSSGANEDEQEESSHKHSLEPAEKIA